MSTLMLAGICWCFCCGTCVGRDLLRLVGADRFIPTSHRYRRHRDYHMPAMEYDIHEQQWEMSPSSYSNNQLDV
ncbi:hypothetical protein VKS41_004815 [Umbelopsis sp. WA50703]